jgi:hypothetical protein
MSSPSRQSPAGLDTAPLPKQSETAEAPKSAALGSASIGFALTRLVNVKSDIDDELDITLG